MPKNRLAGKHCTPINQEDLFVNLPTTPEYHLLWEAAEKEESATIPNKKTTTIDSEGEEVVVNTPPKSSLDRGTEGCNQVASPAVVRKRIGTITIVFVTILLGGQKQGKIGRRASVTAQSEEDIKSTTANGGVLVAQSTATTRIVASSNGGASIRTTCSSSPSPSKRKFQFQNNRTSPYEPQEARHVQHPSTTSTVPGKQLTGDHALELEPLTVGHGSSTSRVGEKTPPLLPDISKSPLQLQRSLPLTLLDSSTGTSPIRPAELLHRRKIYVEGPRQLVGSSSSELSADTNYRNREHQQQQRQNYSDIVVGHTNNCSRQISPASCNSESVASSSAGGTGACGLCSLMPHCAILEGSSSSSAKARKIRGGNTVIVEEELPLPTATAETRETVGASSRTLQNVVANNSSRPGELLGCGVGGTVGTTSARHNSRMSKFNSSSMDRSVDSIGSCSLDVDADSTDFSDTSGSFNLLTPSSAKDFPREFITRIHERCQIQPIAGVLTHHSHQSQLLRQQLQQQTSIVLDPQSGKVNTVLAPVTVPVIVPVPLEPLANTTLSQEAFITTNTTTSESPESEEPKKPSYLNLACCVNGYSNLTTYDSKFRQNINKSREVSPIRPITTTTSQPVTSASGHLGVPQYSYYPQTSQPVGTSTNGFVMDSRQQQSQQRSVMSPEKRLFTAHIMQSATLSSTTTMTTTSKTNGNGDMTDNVAQSKNGNGDLFRTTKYMYTKSEDTNGSLPPVTPMTAQDLNGSNGTPGKSFIEQRVERLYGPGALAQGFHAHRRSMEKTVLAERNIYSNTPSKFGTRINKPVNGNGLYTPKRLSAAEQAANNGGGENTNGQDDGNTIPVLRHLRPEFRAQLPISSSPKRSPPKNGGATNGGGEEEEQVLVSQPMTLQFQTVSISKLKTESDRDREGKKTVANGTVGQGLPVSSEGVIAVTTTTKTEETIESQNSSNNNNIKRSDGGVGDVEHSINIGRNNQATANGGDNRAEVVAVTVVESSVSESESAVEKMPSKQEILVVPVEDKENVMVKGGAVGCSISGKVEKDGNYFSDVMNKERNRILLLADHCDTYIEEVTDNENAEELVGIIRAASGKARLLSSQKMNQFQGLCHNNLHQAADEKFRPTSGDLQGFWDMLMLQVNHIDKLFEEVEALKKNGWKKCPDSTDSLPPPQGAKLVNRRPVATNKANTVKSTSAAASAAAAKREAARKQLMELKRKNKLAMTSGGDAAVAE